MKRTSDNTLNNAVNLHRQGNIEEAVCLYEEILKVHPKDPDANHNMGLILLNSGKTSEALPLFWTALEANPDEWQYWLSYIDALIQAHQLANAQIMYDAVRKAGAVGEVFDEIANRLSDTLDKKAS
jgi:tetratricopeptide (TPR) repeat protein